MQPQTLARRITATNFLKLVNQLAFLTVDLRDVAQVSDQPPPTVLTQQELGSPLAADRHRLAQNRRAFLTMVYRAQHGHQKEQTRESNRNIERNHPTGRRSSSISSPANRYKGRSSLCLRRDPRLPIPAHNRTEHFPLVAAAAEYLLEDTATSRAAKHSPLTVRGPRDDDYREAKSP